MGKNYSFIIVFLVSWVVLFFEKYPFLPLIKVKISWNSPQDFCPRLHGCWLRTSWSLSCLSLLSSFSLTSSWLSSICEWREANPLEQVTGSFPSLPPSLEESNTKLHLGKYKCQRYMMRSSRDCSIFKTGKDAWDPACGWRPDQRPRLLHRYTGEVTESQHILVVVRS